MKKNKKRNNFSYIAFVSTFAVTGLLPIHTQALEKQTTQVIGLFDATTIDVRIPAVTNFIYNPNTEVMTTGNIRISSYTNAPISMNIEAINISEQSGWKPTLVQPDKYTSVDWRNLTKRQSAEQIALGFLALESDQWLFELNNKEIWSTQINGLKKIGTIKNHGIVEGQPTLKAGNSIPVNELLTTNYIFQFGLEEGQSLNDNESGLDEGQSHNGNESDLDEGQSLNGNESGLDEGQSLNGNESDLDEGQSLNEEDKELNDHKEFEMNVDDVIEVNENGSFTFTNSDWTYAGKHTKTLTSDGEFLVKGSNGSGLYTYELPRDMKTATFQLDVKNLANAGGMNSSMFIRTGDKGIGFYFYPDRVEIYSDVFGTPTLTHYLDSTNYHNYRIVKEENNATLYIDKELITTFELAKKTGYSQHRFFFGDGTNGSGYTETYFKNIMVAPGKALYLD